MLQVYRYLTFFSFPLLIILIYLRSIFKKEDKVRFKEKIFRSHFKILKDNDKKLIWFHAASIGECLSIMPLINELNNKHKNIIFLITTVTLSSSKLLEKKLNQYQNIIHRFFPLDLQFLAESFLNNWKPHLVCFVDSEIWPNFLFKIKEKKIPLLLINARITKKSFNKWKVFLNFAKRVFKNFDLCLAASTESQKNLNLLGVKNLKYIGNLKYSIQNDRSEIENSNKKILNDYKTWCAASTHSSEEITVIKTHIQLKKRYNNILTVIVPRHVNRCYYIENLSKKFNLNSQILNDNDLIDSNIEILIINSFGVLPKYFNYCKNIFIGKSLIEKKKGVGGQNPIEAAKSGCKIFHGPYVYNFYEVYELLNSYGISEEINNELELAEKLIKNLENPTIINQAKLDLLDSYGVQILKKTSQEIDVYLK